MLIIGWIMPKIFSLVLFWVMFKKQKKVIKDCSEGTKMTTPKHTNTPWRVSHGTIWGKTIGGCRLEETEFMVAQVRGWGCLSYLGEQEAVAIQEANGRLIAKAPVMYDLLRRVSAMLHKIDTAEFYDESSVIQTEIDELLEVLK